MHVQKKVFKDSEHSIGGGGGEGYVFAKKKSEGSNLGEEGGRGFMDLPSINRSPVVLSPHVLFPHQPTSRFTTTSEQDRGCLWVRELVVGRPVPQITKVSGADMSLVTGARLGKVHV